MKTNMPKMQDVGEAMIALVEVLKELRQKCPWDQVQTNQTLRRFTIEELYEFVDALDNDDQTNIKEELGDILTHVIFYSNLAEENNYFTLTEVINENRKKLICRHPHIYGDGSLNLADDKEVEKNWEKLKGKDKKSMFSGLPSSLPSIIKAHKLQDKAERVGFTWRDYGEAYQKLEEEIQELNNAHQSNQINHVEEEIGDAFFALINYARMRGIDPDIALAKTNNKFKQRFEYMETTLSKEDKKIVDCDMEQLLSLWEESKQQH